MTVDTELVDLFVLAKRLGVGACTAACVAALVDAKEDKWPIRFSIADSDAKSYRQQLKLFFRESRFTDVTLHAQVATSKGTQHASFATDLAHHTQGEGFSRARATLEEKEVKEHIIRVVSCHTTADSEKQRLATQHPGNNNSKNTTTNSQPVDCLRVMIFTNGFPNIWSTGLGDCQVETPCDTAASEDGEVCVRDKSDFLLPHINAHIGTHRHTSRTHRAQSVFVTSIMMLSHLQKMCRVIVKRCVPSHLSTLPSFALSFYFPAEFDDGSRRQHSRDADDSDPAEGRSIELSS